MERVGIAHFKAHLSEHLRRVRQGEELLICDRDAPVARVTACEGAAPGVAVVPAQSPWSQVALPAVRATQDCDVVETLLEQRNERG